MLASQCGLALLEGDFAVTLCSFHIKASPLLSQAVRLTVITKNAPTATSVESTEFRTFRYFTSVPIQTAR